MPQATDELRRWAEEKFGTLDCCVVQEWLEARGFKLSQAWVWSRPARPISAEERDAIEFLIQEWDYGGIEGE